MVVWWCLNYSDLRWYSTTLHIIASRLHIGLFHKSGLYLARWIEFLPNSRFGWTEVPGDRTDVDFKRIPNCKNGWS